MWYVLVIVNIIAMIVALLWVQKQPGYEPLLACFGLLATLVGLLMRTKGEQNNNTIVNNYLSLVRNGSFDVPDLPDALVKAGMLTVKGRRNFTYILSQIELHGEKAPFALYPELKTVKEKRAFLERLK